MWGIFVGIAIGVLQVVGLYVFGKMIIGDNRRKKVIGALLLFAKIALIVMILVLVAKVAVSNVIWAAGGILIGLIASWLYIYKRGLKNKKNI